MLECNPSVKFARANSKTLQDGKELKKEKKSEELVEVFLCILKQ